MFWRFGGYANISTLDTILDKPDVTLEELLDESDLIQELKQQNSKLVEFLRDEPVLKKLLNYVVADAPQEEEVEEGKEKEKGEQEKTSSGGITFFGKGKSRSRSKSVNNKEDAGESEQETREAQRKKYAYVACEVLSSEVWSITEALLENRENLFEFWQYMRRPAPLDPLQAGYFTKVNEALLDKKTEEMLAFFKSLRGIVPSMLQHVDCPMVMDLLLKIISLEKHEGGAGIVDWLQTQDLIPLLLGYLSNEHNSATQTSAGDFLKAIITISANATTQDQSVIGPNELTRQLVTEPCITILIENMLRGGNPLTVGVGIIIEVIRKNNSDYDLDNQVGPEPKTSDPIYLGTLLRQFAIHVPDFMHLIRSPSSKKPELKAAFGRKIEPLGFDRFKTCELMAELLHCSNMGLLNERGAEDEVRTRDADRERLKAEGKLATPKAPTSPSHENSQDEFGSSVDSHGFHHAQKPSPDELDEKPEDVRKLEIQNASDEDGFEKVNAPPESADELPDEVSFDDFNEKIEDSDMPALEKINKRDPTDPTSQSPQITDMPKPLSPSKAKTPMLHFDPPPTHAADSPTSAGVTEQLGRSSIDEDTVMTEFGEEPGEVHDDEQMTELERELAKQAEKPAPLFARKEQADAVDPIQGAPSPVDEQTEDVDKSVATIQGEPDGGDVGERPPFETEADGSPVVGDLLKMKFVEHHVVPTILDFFFRFPWNNFLHNVVYDVVQQVFNGTLDRGYNRAIALDLFEPIIPSSDPTTCPSDADNDIGLLSKKDITDRILDGQAASDLSQQNKGMRLGYMGHLTLIAEEVCKFGARAPSVSERVQRPEWMEYVEGTLASTREKDNAVLGGVRPENAIGMRAGNAGSLGGGGGMGGGLGGGQGLAGAGLLSEGTVGQAFEIEGGMAEEEVGGGGGESPSAGIADDEQTHQQQQQSSDTSSSSSAPAPLNVPPSRARRQLAARLAQKQQAGNAGGSGGDGHDDGDGDGDGLQLTGQMRNTVPAGSSRFEGLFGSEGIDSDSDEDDDGDTRATDGGRDGGEGVKNTGRRQSTTEAKERRPLEDDEAEGAGEGSPFADPDEEEGQGEESSSSSEDDLVEIRPRRAG